MKILFHLGHPAHFHLFKNVILRLKESGHQVNILIKEKEVLRQLLIDADFEYTNILPEGKSSGKFGLFVDLARRSRRIIQYCRETRPDLLVGTSADISYTGKLLGIPTLNINEDDASVVPLYAWMSYPLATLIMSPDSCDNGRWNKKTFFYPGYHELAYLHPGLFTPDTMIAGKYMNLVKKNFLVRFAGLSAHHDSGIRGIDNELALKLVDELKNYGNVFITSERRLHPDLEDYRLSINPSDIHHVLACASLVIGDSQTMSAESGVLGTPYIRYNDFVGKIGYLNELEKVYKLGFGITPDNPEKLLIKATELAKMDAKKSFEARRKKMLSEKRNVTNLIYDKIIELTIKN